MAPRAPLHAHASASDGAPASRLASTPLSLVPIPLFVVQGRESSVVYAGLLCFPSQSSPLAYNRPEMVNRWSTDSRQMAYRWPSDGQQIVNRTVRDRGLQSTTDAQQMICSHVHLSSVRFFSSRLSANGFGKTTFRALFSTFQWLERSLVALRPPPLGYCGSETLDERHSTTADARLWPSQEPLRVGTPSYALCYV